MALALNPRRCTLLFVKNSEYPVIPVEPRQSESIAAKNKVEPLIELILMCPFYHYSVADCNQGARTLIYLCQLSAATIC